MDVVGVDLFSIKMNDDWLVMVDAYSGYPFVKKMHSTTTNAVAHQLTKWMNSAGWVKTLKSDGGPCFKSKEFENFCKHYGIIHEKSSAYYAQSNGLAESAVKNVKTLLKKCLDSGENFYSALSEWTNTPRDDGFSPAELFYGRKKRTLLPLLGGEYKLSAEQVEQAEKSREEARLKRKESFDKNAISLPPLQIDQRVVVQNPISKKWDKKATIKKAFHNNRSFLLEDEHGYTFNRNRRFLRPLFNEDDVEERSNVEKEEESNQKPMTHKRKEDASNLPLRRSKRITSKQKCVSFNENAITHLI